MISKTLTGVPFFDDRFGGIYRGRAMLVSGRSGSGKSLFGLHFIAHGIRQAERCLLLSGRQAVDVAIYSAAAGLSLMDAVDDGKVILLEYSDYVPGRAGEADLVLPPEGFVQLQEMIQANAIQRVVLDTCMPWMTLPSSANLAQHVFSFVRSFDRLGVTMLLTLPKPVSPMAFKLKSILEETVPVAATLSMDEATEQRLCIVTKYLGESRPDVGTRFEVRPGEGLCLPLETPISTATPPPRAEVVSADVSRETAPPFRAPEAPKPSSPRKIRFSNVLLGNAEEPTGDAKMKELSFSQIMDESL